MRKILFLLLVMLAVISVSVALAQTEGGSIAYGETVSGQLDDSDGITYTFQGSEGDEVVIDTEGSAFDTTLTLYASDESQLRFDDDGGAGLTSQITYTLPADDAYTILVRGFGGGTGTYQLTLAEGTVVAVDITSTPAPTGTIPPELESQVIDYGDTVSGTLTNRDGMYFVFAGIRGDTVRIDTEGSDFDTVLTLYGTDDAELITDDDGGTGTRSLITYTLPRSGLYSVLLRGFGGVIGDYQLNVYVGDDAANFPTPTPNFGATATELVSQATATAAAEQASAGETLSYGDTASGTLTNPDGIRFAFTGSAGDTIEVNSNGSNFDTTLTLYDTNGAELAYNDDGGDGLQSLISITLVEDGEYSILLRGFGGATGDYELSLSAGTGTTVTPVPPTGDTLSYGASISGTLTNPDGETFTFVGSAGDTVEINTNGSSFDTVLLLYDSSGVEVAYNDDGGEGLQSLISYTLLEAGEYSILLRGFGGATGDYELSLSAGTGTTVTPVPLTGDTLSYGASISGTLTNPDGETFTFVGSAGDTVAIDSNGSSFDTTLTLYDSSGVELAYNDDGGEGLQSLISYTLVEDGEYSILLRGFGGAIGDYQLSLNLGDGTIITPPPTGDTITFGETLSGTLESADGQYFTFTGIEGDSIQIDSNGSDFDTTLTLYDPSGAELVYNDDGGRGLQSLITYTLTDSGDYSVLLQGFGGATGEYQLTLAYYEELVLPTPIPIETVNAGDVGYGDSLSGTLNEGIELVYFLQASSGDEIVIDTEGSDFDTILTLSAPNGAELVYDDDSGEDLTSRIEYTIDADGQYSILLRGFGGLGGEYHLNVQLAGNPTIEVVDMQDGKVPSIEVCNNVAGDCIVIIVTDGSNVDELLNQLNGVGE